MDLFDRTEELVDIPSVSHDETAITDHIHGLLADVSWLHLDRVGNNLVARTDLGRSLRLVLAGHTDTVPANGNDRARRDGDVLWGLGSADMKSGVAVILELARRIEAPAVDVTYVFYECEEVDSAHNGLNRLLRERPDLVEGDAAVLAEPTGARIEAGCQGTLRARVTLTGVRAHTARPWMGRNAIHRLGTVLERVAAFEGRRPVLDGCEYREAMQAVRVSGGVAGNVVPDVATVELNHRFAPDRSAADAEAQVRDVVGELEDADTFELIDSAPPAPPSLVHPLLAGLAERSGVPPRAKLGWTDVAFFASRGVPATNFGPGDPTLAHTKDERVERGDIDHVYATLEGLLIDGA